MSIEQDNPWRDADTAPVGVSVEFGWWENAYSMDKTHLYWRNSTGPVWQRTLFGKRRASGASQATHWRYLPDPPEGKA